MTDKTKEELIEEISLLQKRIAGVEILDTERKQVEERVKKQYEFVKTIIDSLSYPFYVIDTDYTIILVNQAARKKGIVEGSRCYQVTHHRQEPCSAEHACPFKEVIRTNKPVVTEHIHFDNEGNCRNFEVHGDPIFGKDGQAIQMIEYAIDITERKRAEEENIKHMQELQATYSKLKEVQSQLIQSSKMASLGQMAGGVAHEINNPLTGVLNNVQLIKMVAGNKECFDIKEFKDLLDIIEESAKRCSQITRSLLDFSHASKGILEPVSLNEIVSKVAVLIEHELKLQNILIQKELQPDLPLILGDSQLLQQVIFNFISNAKWAIQKKSAKEGGTITIKTQYEALKKEVYIFVSDSGVGIPKENLKKIFDPFFSTKVVGEGTGLGLSIVYGIIDAHKGTITVESELGVGTTFKVSLPAQQVD